MSDTYFESQSHNFKSVNGKVIENDTKTKKCYKGFDGKALCILNAPTLKKSLMETLEDDYPVDNMQKKLSKKKSKAKSKINSKSKKRSKSKY